ncbi:hypothetical protein IMCC26207_108278 [Actinobacteria bacterium IMCC26207]|nr:hypothetical protein IMCC26207_108278 [Actinobacteria bacterium IMCC26207]
MKRSLRSKFIQHMMIHRRPSGSQEGYVLITALAGMLLCIIIISSLLAVTLSTMSIEESGRTREKQNRAAEGAVDVAINQIRNSASIAASDLPQYKTSGDVGYDPTKKSNEQLPKVFGDAGYDKARDPVVNPRLANAACDPVYNLVNIEGTPVRIYCYNDGLSQYDSLGNQIAGVPQDDGGVALRLVGDEYKGDPNPASDPLSATGDKARLWKTQFPFGGAMQGFSQAEVDSTKGQLVYTGATPLKVTGGVEVKNQIAAVTEAGRTGPALLVDGFAAQGGPGMFDPETGTKGCGIAEPSDSLNALRADVQANSIYSAPDNSLICGNPELSVMGAGGMPSPSGDWNNARVQSSKYQDWDGFNGKFRQDNSGLYDVLNTDCERFNIGSGIISIPAGSYDSKATKILNQWFGGGCPNRTFYFEGGDYWFDVDDPSLPETDPKKHSLVFGSYENNWVFGKRNWAGARPMNSEFPNKACVRTAPSPSSPDGSSGVSITLSARTGLNHSAGRVAICGPILKQQVATDPVPTQTTAIWQRPATSLGARLLPDTWSSVTTAPAFAGVSDAPRLADRNSLKVTQDVSAACWDSGTCLFEKTFRLAGMGIRALDGADPGPGLLGSAWIDLTADADFANNPANNLAYTKFALALSDGKTCNMRFGTANNALASRLTDNYATTSYNLLDDPVAGTSDGIDGDCDTVMTAANGVGREDLRNATIDVTVGLNPPKLTNTIASTFVRGVVNFALFWRNLFTNPDISFDQFFAQLCPPAVSFFRLFGRSYACDDRPVGVSYSVDAVAVRLGWTPSFDTPTNEPSGLNANFTNPSLGAKEAVPQYATLTSSAISTGTSVGKLQYRLKDPNLLDGFLPVRSLTLTAKIKKPATANANDKVDFTLLTHSGLQCTVSVPFSSFADDVETSFTLNPTSGTTCRIGASGAFVNAMEIGELVSHQDSPCNPCLAASNNVFTSLQALVLMQNTGTTRTFGMDYATLQATAGDTDSLGNTVGYPRPKDPFTVTWNPLTENKTYSNPTAGIPSPRNGDASFTVFGSVSVPNQDVRVIWNWNNAVDPPDDPGKPIAAGPTGFAIFNGGSVTSDKCSPTVAEFCRPGLVASALGSWTTGTWPTNPTVTQQPDALASSGATRFPFRSARIVACVLDEKGNTDPTDDELLPRLDAKVLIADKQGNAVTTGSKVSVIDWKILKSGTWKYGADAANDPCNIYA